MIKLLYILLLIILTISGTFLMYNSISGGGWLIFITFVGIVKMDEIFNKRKYEKK